MDSSALVALVVEDHVHHDAARQWMAGSSEAFATCPITQGALVRILLMSGILGAEAQQILQAVLASPRHEFWPDDVSYGEVDLTALVGHRQVTDAYLAQLTRRHGGRLVTLDRGLAESHADVADLIPI